jgi:SAM-dependent methyltransferase
LFAGEWSTVLPVDAVTGAAPLIGDARLVSCVAAVGGVDGENMLELGPLEGAHSLMLRRDLGASNVVAIEANAGAFLRCLITKELMHLDGVEFRFGDFRPYLDSTTDRFDLAAAIGVLYHLDDPVPVLENLARVSDRIVIWSHVYNTEFDVDRLAGRFDPPVDRWLGDTSYRLHPYRYEESLEWSGFCGGTRPTAAWIERDDLISVVTSLGFEIALRDDHDHLGTATLRPARRGNRRPPDTGPYLAPDIRPRREDFPRVVKGMSHSGRHNVPCQVGFANSPVGRGG